MDSGNFVTTLVKYRDDYGWSPFGLDYKKPIIAWQPFQYRKVSDREVASMAKAKVETLNIGVATGEISGFIVLDIDGDEGFTALERNNITIPATLTVTTGKGKHYYFKYTENSKKLKTRANYLPKVDIRADGGYVVVPPSYHIDSGNFYKFDNPDTPIAEMPEDLIELLINAVPTITRPKDEVPGTPLVERIRAGSRNDLLFREASFLKARGYGDDLIKETIIKLNSSLLEPVDEDELHDTLLRSALNYGVSTVVEKLDDTGNANRMVNLFTDKLCYIPERKKWAYYNGSFWELDPENRAAFEKFIGMTNTIVAEMPEPDDEDVEALKAHDARVKFANSCRNLGRIKSGLEITRSKMCVSELDFDADEWLLGTKEGTLDLKTLSLKDPTPRNYIMKVSNASYDPEARCPRWDQFISEIFDKEQDLIHYVQKAVGYTLTGSNREKAFFILHGSGNNGKSVFLNVIGHILGDFYKKASFDTFTTRGKNKQIRNDLAGLRGARIVVASETSEGDRLDESLIKDITGGEPITCRFLFGEDFQYTPEFKMWFSTNHLPDVRDNSTGMWDRVKTIPFTVTIPREKRDVHLTNTLKDEASGILNWCLKGLEMYMSEGLEAPQIITTTVQQYRDDNDPFGMFIRERLVENPASRIERGRMFQEFNQWCDETKSYPRGMSSRKFYKKMRERDFEEIKSHGEWYFSGAELRGDTNFNVTKVDGNVIYATPHDGDF